MSRWEDRQVLRSLGWRGSKAKRQRSYPRPELAPYREPQEPQDSEE